MVTYEVYFEKTVSKNGRQIRISHKICPGLC